MVIGELPWQQLCYPPHSCSAKFAYILLYSFSVLQEIVFQGRRVCEQQTNTLSNKTSLPQSHQWTEGVLLINL